MTLILTLDDCTAPRPPELAKIFTEKLLPKDPDGTGIWRIHNEISPDTLYCYLQAKYGDPNGLQNIFRKDDSDNLIHWEWALKNKNGLILIMGLNLRTEVHLLGTWDFPKRSQDQFIRYIKSDLKNYGKEMSAFRKKCLEHWDIFTNPYHDINSSVEQMIRDIAELNLDPAKDELPNPTVASEMKAHVEKWESMRERYNRGIGMALGLKSLIPVLAESFVNLLLYILCRPEVKKNSRLYQSVVRANIDIKIQSLHLHCIGFKSPVEWTSVECSAYNSIVNERNDLLHGNINIDKLKYQDIYFRGKVPIFKNYNTMWQQSISVSIRTSGIEIVNDWLKTVRAFEDYVLGMLEDGLEDHVRLMMSKRDIGLNRANGRLGILLPDHVVDFGMGIIQESGQQGAESDASGTD